MKILSLILLLFFSTYLQAEPFIASGGELEIDRNKLQIDNQCRLKVTNKEGESRLIKLSLPESPACKFVVFEGTNAIDMRIIGTAHMFFIELQTGSGDKCRTQYVAIAGRKDRPIITSAKYARSSTCPPNLEMNEFIYFARRMEVLK